MDNTSLPARVAAKVDRARGNAAGTHADRRTRRTRDRGAAKRAAIQEGRAR